MAKSYTLICFVRLYSARCGNLFYLDRFLIAQILYVRSRTIRLLRIILHYGVIIALRGILNSSRNRRIRRFTVTLGRPIFNIPITMGMMMIIFLYFPFNQRNLCFIGVYFVIVRVNIIAVYFTSMSRLSCKDELLWLRELLLQRVGIDLRLDFVKVFAFILLILTTLTPLTFVTFV